MLQGHLLAHPRDWRVLWQAGGVLHAMGRSDQAVEHLKAALVNFPEGAPAAANAARFSLLRDLGDCSLSAGFCREAGDYYRQAADAAPDQPQPHVGMGTAAVQAGDIPAALTAFQAAAAIDPDCAEAYSGLAMAYQKTGDYPAALEMYLKCLELDSDNLVALLGLFQTSCRMKSFAKIIHYLEIYLRRHQGDSSVLFCLGALYARQGRLADAQKALLAVLAAEPDKTEAAELLGRLQRAAAGETPKVASCGR